MTPAVKERIRERARADVARLPDAVAALGRALATGGSELEPAAVAAARSVLAKVDRRLAITGGHTVAALAGATGSGKSSLFNQLVGEPVAEIGARRPTTSRPAAAVWGGESAAGLLDWLGVGRRHTVTTRSGDAEASALDLDGLVLLDLPDFDSRVVEHREEADRILGLVDVFIWVTDPQKYADGRLHEDYLRALAGHGARMVVVLNQADRLAPEEVVACRDDLVRLLAQDGVTGAETVICSAVRGEGVVDLTFALGQVVQERTAARARLLGDVTLAAARLLEGVGSSEVDVTAVAHDGLAEALARSAGVPAVLDAVSRHHLMQARARTGWPFTRWLRRFRPDPLRRLRLEPAVPTGALGVTAADVRAVLGRSSLPHPTPAARAAVQVATASLADQAGSGLPARWALAAADAAAPPGPDLADALDQAVLSTPLRVRDPKWWAVASLLQWAFAVGALAGAGWLAGLALAGFLQLPVADPPLVGVLPVPLILAAGGVLGGLLLARLAAAASRVGARRRRAAVARRLGEAIGLVAEERIVSPVRAVLDRHRRTRELLVTARG